MSTRPVSRRATLLGPTAPARSAALLRAAAATSLSVASLCGCTIIDLGATVAETAVSVAGTAVSAAGTVVTTTGKVVGGAVDAATSSSSNPGQ